MYFDEEMILDLRLNILNKYVDYFVIVESIFTHRGEKKELKFNLNKFGQFKDKIIYLIYNQVPKNLEIINKEDTEKEKSDKLIMNAIFRENEQRNFLERGLENAKDEDVILISDVDEIPNLDNLDFNQIHQKIFIFEQNMFYYKFNLKLPDFSWKGTKGCKKKYFKNPQWLRNIKDRKYPFYRIDTFFSEKKYINCKIIKNGGWHFTNIKTPEELFEKFSNFGHHDEFELANIDVDKIKEKVTNKEVFYDHLADKGSSNRWSDNYKLKKIDLNYLPKYLVENSEKFKDWID